MNTERPRGPKVFLSHATEDKDRFALGFGRKLRARGVDAWVDEWEMLPGDSLIQKVFEEGLDLPEAVIVIVSAISVTKPWVREEMDAAFVRRIEDGSRLIPVIIEKCDIPGCLRHILQVRISDLSNYERELEKTVAAIFGICDRPPLGEPPQHAAVVAPQVDDLTRGDVLVLKSYCDIALQSNSYGIVMTESAWAAAKSLDIPRDEFLDSVHILCRKGYLKQSQVLAPYPPHCGMTIYGFDRYAQMYIRDYPGKVNALIATIVNNGITDKDELASRLGFPKALARHILLLLESRELVTLADGLGDKMRVISRDPELDRMLSDTR